MDGFQKLLIKSANVTGEKFRKTKKSILSRTLLKSDCETSSNHITGTSLGEFVLQCFLKYKLFLVLALEIVLIGLFGNYDHCGCFVLAHSTQVGSFLSSLSAFYTDTNFLYLPAFIYTLVKVLILPLQRGFWFESQSGLL